MDHEDPVAEEQGRADRGRTIQRGVLLYLAMVWLAALFQVEAFPLTWMPMYSGAAPKDTISAPDRQREPARLWVEHRDGSTHELQRHDLNLAKHDWRKLGEKRVFQAARAAERGGQRSRRLDRLGRWFHERLGATGHMIRDGDRRLLCSVNRTLGRAPTDPDFIVAVLAHRTRHRIDRQSLRDLGSERDSATVFWRDEWSSECL